MLSRHMDSKVAPREIVMMYARKNTRKMILPELTE